MRAPRSWRPTDGTTALDSATVLIFAGVERCSSFRPGVSYAELRRMAAQLPDEEKIKAADYVIDNSGSLDETESRVGEIYRELKCSAEESNLKSL